jgi:hypothetical protein
MDSWDLMTKKIEKKDNNINKKYVNDEIKKSVLILGSPINLNAKNNDYAPSKQNVSKLSNINKRFIEKYPTNIKFANQGGSGRAFGTKGVQSRMLTASKGVQRTGSALYAKNSDIIMGSGKYKMRDSTKRFFGRAEGVQLEGGALSQSSYSYKYEDPLKVDSESMLYNVMKYIGQKFTRPLLKKILGGAKLTDKQQQTVNDVMQQMKLNKESQKSKNQQKMDLKDEQMLIQKLNPIDKKEIARRKVLSGLTDKQKMAYMRMQNKEGKKQYDAKVAEFDRLASVERRANEEDDWRNTQKADRQAALDEQARLKRIADEKANKPWYSKLGDEALNLIPEAAGLIPVKFLQAPAKALLKEGVSSLKGLGKKKRGRPPSAWNIKVKEYMNKYGGSMKEALQALKK